MNPGLLPEVAEVHRPTRDGDGQGGWATSMKSVGTLRCRISGASGASQTNRGGTADADVTHSAVFRFGGVLHRGDVLVAGGVRYEVRSVRKPPGPLRHGTAELREIEVNQ